MGLVRTTGSEKQKKNSNYKRNEGLDLDSQQSQWASLYSSQVVLLDFQPPNSHQSPLTTDPSFLVFLGFAHLYYHGAH